MKKITQSSSIRLTLEAKHLWRALAQQSGITLTAMLELMIREKATRERIPPTFKKKDGV